MQCPCQSSRLYADCCEPYHTGEAPHTAEALMRSRYAAYVLNNSKYVYKSWAKTTRPSKKSLANEGGTDWTGLRIIRTESGGLFDNEGIVEFIASYQSNGQQRQLHETSRFIRENGRWVYLDGQY